MPTSGSISFVIACVICLIVMVTFSPTFGLGLFFGVLAGAALWSDDS